MKTHTFLKNIPLAPFKKRGKKWGIIAVLLLIFLIGSKIFAGIDSQPGKSATGVAPAKTRVFFIENRGQHDDKVKYYLRGAHGSVFFTQEEVVFSFCRKEERRPQKRGKTTGKDDETSAARLVFRFKFDGANPQPVIIGQKKLPGKINYFVGSRENWKSSIPTFEEVLYQDVYDGVDLVFSLSSNNPRYAIHLREGTDLGQVRFTYEGVEGLEVNDKGHLVISTSFGDFVEPPPEVRRGGKAVDVRFRLIGENGVGFEVHEESGR